MLFSKIEDKYSKSRTVYKDYEAKIILFVFSLSSLFFFSFSFPQFFFLQNKFTNKQPQQVKHVRNNRRYWTAGGLVIKALMEKGVKPSALVRCPEKAASCIPQGVCTRKFDYSSPSSDLYTALTGITRLLVISGSDIANRLASIST